jgi:WD40 repeat protein
VGHINFAAYAPDGSYIAAIDSVAEFSRLIIWDASDATKLQEIRLEGEAVFDLACSPDSEYLICGDVVEDGGNGLISVFRRDGKNFGKQSQVLIEGTIEFGTDVGVSLDSEFGFAALEGGVDIFRLSDGSIVHSFSDFGWLTQAAFLPDGALIVVTDELRSRIIELGTGDSKEFSTSTGEPLRVLLSPTKDRCFIWDASSIFEWNISSGETQYVTEKPSDTAFHVSPYSPGDVSPTGTRLVTSFDASIVKVFDVYTRSIIHEFSTPYRMINDVVFAGNEDTVLIADHDQGVSLWDVTAGTEIRRYLTD